MASHNHSSFYGTTIRLDGNSYTNCEFTDCMIVYAGGVPGQFGNNRLVNTRFTFEGPALNTLRLLADFYQGGLHQVVNEIIDQIRRGPSTGAP